MSRLTTKVETRGIEPLTPALQTYGERGPAPYRACQRGAARVWAAWTGCSRPELDAIVDAIASTIDRFRSAFAIIISRLVHIEPTYPQIPHAILTQGARQADR